MAVSTVITRSNPATTAAVAAKSAPCGRASMPASRQGAASSRSAPNCSSTTWAPSPCNPCSSSSRAAASRLRRSYSRAVTASSSLRPAAHTTPMRRPPPGNGQAGACSQLAPSGSGASPSSSGRLNSDPCSPGQGAGPSAGLARTKGWGTKPTSAWRSKATRHGSTSSCSGGAAAPRRRTRGPSQRRCCRVSPSPCSLHTSNGARQPSGSPRQAVAGSRQGSTPGSCQRRSARA